MLQKIRRRNHPPLRTKFDQIWFFWVESWGFEFVTLWKSFWDQGNGRQALCECRGRTSQVTWRLFQSRYRRERSLQVGKLFFLGSVAPPGCNRGKGFPNPKRPVVTVKSGWGVDPIDILFSEISRCVYMDDLPPKCSIYGIFILIHFSWFMYMYEKNPSHSVHLGLMSILLVPCGNICIPWHGCFIMVTNWAMKKTLCLFRIYRVCRY